LEKRKISNVENLWTNLWTKIVCENLWLFIDTPVAVDIVAYEERHYCTNYILDEMWQLSSWHSWFLFSHAMSHSRLETKELYVRIVILQGLYIA
jgi:hypothetical protein